MTDYAKSRPTDSAERWRQMGPLWDRASNLILNVNIKPLYIEAMLRQALDEGVSYLGMCAPQLFQHVMFSYKNNNSNNSTINHYCSFFLYIIA